MNFDLEEFKRKTNYNRNVDKGDEDFYVGEYEKAIKHYKKALVNAPSTTVQDQEQCERNIIDSEILLEKIGDIYDKLGELESALDYYKKAVQLDPEGLTAVDIKTKVCEKYDVQI